MKIIVASEAEKELMTRFLDLYNEIDGTELVEDIDEDPKLPAEIKSEEYRFIRDGFKSYKIEVGKIYHMITNDDVITGTCHKCGLKTEGIYISGGDVTYDDYRAQMSPESQENWLCEICQTEERLYINKTGQCETYEPGKSDWYKGLDGSAGGAEGSEDKAHEM